MAAYRHTGYQYETSPRKLEPEYEPRKNPYAKKKSSMLKKKNKHEKPKRQLKTHVKAVLYVGFIFLALFAISYQNSLINESFNKNEKLKKVLVATQKENEQLQVNIENSLNLSNVEKLAKEKLGMQKLSSKQKVYVSLPKRDYVEPAVEEVIIEQNESWFQKIINLFTGK